MTRYLKPYIEALIQNVDPASTPSEFDVVFDGGALNGFMAFGVAMYLRGLEEAGLVKVRRLSGCSAGALVALMYFIDIYYDIEPFFTSLLQHYHTHRNFAEYMVKIREIIYENLTDDLKILNGKLFITYFDTMTQKQVVVSQYANREELFHCIARSSHIPYISSSIFKYQERYVDGVTPYIFQGNNRRVLFVKLVHVFNVDRFLNVRNETNPKSRIFEGLIDANLFFNQGHSQMCSYVDTWCDIDFLMMRLRIIVFLTGVVFLEEFNFLHYFEPKLCCNIQRQFIDWLKN